MIRSIVVFCGSSSGTNEIYLNTAAELGKVMAERKIELVYGGAKVGLMGAIADAVLAGGGTVRGVIPDFLRTREVAHESITELLEVTSMHERKLRMHELSEAIIALPGGWGTLEELFEMMTWAQLGLHPKPIGILNVAGYYDPLIAQIGRMTDEGFLKEVYRDMVIISADIHELLTLMNDYKAPEVPKWIDRSAS